MQVIQAFKTLAERSGWGSLPRFALGASSGGAMVLALALRMPLDGVCPMIMAVPPQLLETRPGDPASGKTWAFPPTFFSHMERDSNTARAVAADMAALKKQARSQRFFALYLLPKLARAIFAHMDNALNACRVNVRALRFMLRLAFR